MHFLIKISYLSFISGVALNYCALKGSSWKQQWNSIAFCRLGRLKNLREVSVNLWMILITCGIRELSLIPDPLTVYTSNISRDKFAWNLQST